LSIYIAPLQDIYSALAYIMSVSRTMRRKRRHQWQAHTHTHLEATNGYLYNGNQFVNWCIVFLNRPRREVVTMWRSKLNRQKLCCWLTSPSQNLSVHLPNSYVTLLLW